MPSFVDFVVLVGLSLILCYVLRTLKKMSDHWKKMMDDRIKAAEEKRKLVKDPFRNTNGYSWDYCMVFNVTPVENKMKPIQQENSLKFIIGRLTDAGLQNKLFYSVQRDEVILKIRAPLKRLMREADRTDYRLALEPTCFANKLREGHEKGPIEKQWKGIEVPFKSHETRIEPFEYMYMDYRKDADPELYKKYPNDTIFRGVDRLKLIATIISGRIGEGGAHLDVYRLIKTKCMITFFPLHDAVELQTLENNWLKMCQLPWYQNVDAVKDYFGEKIGLFFVFLGHYTTWLIFPAFVGLLVWSNVAADNNDPNAALVPYFATFIAIWATLFLEFWKRKENYTSMYWGTEGFEEEEQDRPEFEGTPSVSPIDGSKKLYFPRRIFYCRVTVSVNIISVLILIVLCVVGSIFYVRIILNHIQALVIAGVATGSIIAALINAIQIQVLNAIYQTIAIKMTDYENHRTDTEYEDALIAKTFIFQFVNSFASLFYIAFVKPYIPTLDPCLGSCLVEVQTGLGTIFMTRLATGSLVKLIVPWILAKLKTKNETKGIEFPEEVLTDVEKAYIQAEYHVLLGPFADYANLAIQFGYSTMFIAAYPLAMTMCLLTNYVELRVDAWKLCHLCRRPEPRTSEDIGTWYTIFEVISSAAVLTNAALIAFTGTFTQEYTWVGRVWIFVSICAAILMVKYLIAIYIPDFPREVEIQAKRLKFYLSKIVDNVPDEDDTALLEGIKSDVKYAIRINDDDPL